MGFICSWHLKTFRFLPPTLRLYARRDNVFTSGYCITIYLLFIPSYLLIIFFFFASFIDLFCSFRIKNIFIRITCMAKAKSMILYKIVFHPHSLSKYICLYGIPTDEKKKNITKERKKSWGWWCWGSFGCSGYFFFSSSSSLLFS